jgi:hypothetical protein
MKVRHVFALALAVSLVAPSLRAETAEQWIAKARAYLGSESALNAVTSIHFIGRLETTEPVPVSGDKTRLVNQSVTLPAEIIFQKPCQQLVILKRPGTIETKALDDYDGWARSTNAQNPKQWRLTLLEVPEIRQLRANTWENLNFFAGLEKKGGRVVLRGEVTVDGLACVQLSFIHSDEIVFQRYFDRATGRLVKTETGRGAEIREEGEIIVEGVRFPRTVISKSANGQIDTITFEKVMLNERIDASEFAVPGF